MQVSSSTNSSRDPVHSMRHPMVDPRLPRLRTRIPSGHYTNQIPPPLPLQHQRSTGVPLAAVPPPIFVPRTQHLVVDDDADALGPVPPLAHPVVDHGHLHRLQRLGAKSGPGAERPPSGGHPDFPQEVLAPRGQADWGNVGKLVGRSIQSQDGDVEAVRLGGELEVGVHLEERSETIESVWGGICGK